MLGYARNTILPILKSMTARKGPVDVVPAPVIDTRPPERNLSIPICDNSFEHDNQHEAQKYGQFLARQDRWDDLSHEIQQADQNRETTAAGLPIADLLSYGARADVVRAVEHALLDGKGSKDRILLDGINGLEQVRRDNPGDAYIALVLAQAHIDIGWVWRGRGPEKTVSAHNLGKFAAHFDRASKILAPYEKAELNSPALAAAQCALLAGQNDPHLRIGDSYERLIDLHPENHRHMRVMGHHLLPRWFGTYQQLEIEARRTAARTQKVWGSGAYAWVYFDALVLDDHACTVVDVDFFIDGLHDIVLARPEQETINLLASYCAVAMRPVLGENAAAEQARQRISDCAKWLIRDHLTEVHPMVWAHAAEGFDNNAHITSVARFAARGRADALQAIADQFRDEMRRGLQVTFTDNGPEVHPA